MDDIIMEDLSSTDVALKRDLENSLDMSSSPAVTNEMDKLEKTSSSIANNLFSITIFGWGNTVNGELGRI